MQTVLYARVSTADQTLEHQRTQAERAGYAFDVVVADHGVSGVSTKLRDRAEGRRLFDMLRRGDVLVVRWVDRLGRNYTDVTETLREFMNRGVVVRTIINGMEFDGATTDPMKCAIRDSMIAFLAAMAQAHAEATKDAQRAGIDHAKGRQTAYRGRKPSFTQAQYDLVQEMLAAGRGVSDIGKSTGLSRQTIYRLRDNPAGAERALESWR
ncbi:recombinase family protein [Methylopila sp. M107]|uniref:recombinase family protein n=1 Tax=Methylopila sp. M107 TaxID=1101190 RepID=UPI00037CD1BB|nr:recombinase family protein [Methylopila sp. M107]